jgi:hypothetical protein
MTYELDPDCYSLAPGETLLMQASYFPLQSWPTAPLGSKVPTGSISAREWQKIGVPAGWKDDLIKNH